MKFENKPLNLLVVEDNPGDFVLLKKKLQRTEIAVDNLHWAERLEDVNPILDEHFVDMAFLDLSLSDSTGIQSFIDLNKQLPQTPIIVLSGLADMEVALKTISLGAQDYLMKGEFDEKLLAKSIQYGLERKKILENLRESNERYEIVNKATLDIIWDWNFSTDALFLSSSVKEILGYINQDVNMKWFFDHINPDDLENVRQSLSNTIENGKNHWEAEFWFLLPDGTYKFIFSRGYTLFDNNGKAYRMIGAATDLTEKHKLENQLVAEKLKQQKLITETTIQAQEKERNELGEELHDNINQILATVKMYIGIVKSERNEDLLDRSYKYINEAMEEIRKLSKTLVTPSLGNVGLQEALEELVEEINVAGELQVQLIIEIKKGGIIEAQKELMVYRIVQEQMNNIQKYAKAKKCTINIQSNDKALLLSISDNGVGFDMKKKSKGIGLKNIQNRVEFYSGKLEIVSLPGHGCTLKVSIPL